jgi:hypothetical protein
LEKIVLPILATAVTILIFLNPIKFDWPQRISLFVAAIAFGYFVSHTLHLRNEAIRLRTTRPTVEKSTPSPSQAQSSATSIKQTSADSKCSNVASGGDVTINCSSEVKEKNVKNPKSKGP